jgi:hypothetical protein
MGSSHAILTRRTDLGHLSLGITDLVLEQAIDVPRHPATEELGGVEDSCPSP